MEREVIIDSIHKYEINGNMVSFYELMGNRWVMLGTPERWSDELIYEEFGI